MSDDLRTLELRDGDAWRAWLQAHHAASPGVWLVFHKRHTGVTCISYEASVRQALCFGWIDSLVRRLDEDRYVRKFTPRKPRSNWSATNRRRWIELKEDGLLADAGLAAAPTDLAPRTTAGDSGAAGLHRRGLPCGTAGVAVLPTARPHLSAALRGLDSHGQAAGHA